MRNITIQFMILIVSIVIGIVAAVQGFTLIIAGLVFFHLLVFIVLATPEPVRSPIKLLNNIFAFFLVLYVIWPGYISIWLVPGIPGLNPPRVLYMLLLLIWGLSLLGSSQMTKTLFDRLNNNLMPASLLTAIVLWKFFSVFNSEAPVFAFIEYLTEMVGVYVVFLVAISTTNSITDIRRLLYAIVIAAFVVSLLGIYEALTKNLIFAHFVTADNEFLRFVVGDKSRGGDYRVQSTFSHPLLYAEFLIFSLPIAAYIFAQKRPNFQNVLLSFIMVVMIFALLLAKSRAGLAALLVVVLLGVALLSIKLIFFNKRSYFRFFLPVSLFLLEGALLVAVGPMLWDAISGTRLEHQSTQARLYFLKLGLSLISDQPLLGYGGAIEAIKRMGVFSTIDNYYLSLALEAGIPALMFFLLTYTYFVLLGVRLFFSQEKEKSFLALALTLSLVAFAVFKLILSVPYNHPFIMLTFALMFMLRVICLRPEVPNARLPN